MSVCVMKTIYSLWLDLDIMSLWSKTIDVVVTLAVKLSLIGVLKIYMLLVMSKPRNCIIDGAMMYCEHY
jgi:hypothetical protein